MNPVLKQIIATREVEDKNGNLINIDKTSISYQEGDLIQKYIRHIKAERSLEVGLAYGTSSLYICDALEKTERTAHYVIDPYQNNEGVVWESIGIMNLKKAGFMDFTRFFEEPSHLAITQLEREKVEVDFVFIDGEHTFDHVLVDFFLSDKILRDGGIIVFDDTDWPSIRRACSFIIRNRDYKVLDFLPSYHTKKGLSMKHKLYQNIVYVQETLVPENTYFLPKDAQHGGKIDQMTAGGMLVMQKIKSDTRAASYYNEF
ncbi:class I SAM-dependent methyltransferase [Bernardetia sp.]|uniref:class I SAM-dependent methyltransferase n=1 Tax=Bernardetia sp. TaxID=1937974 RepID=UPI0025BEC038|nr:class I SAM-dependent methyltransferase [Bernardetia sp.]